MFIVRKGVAVARDGIGHIAAFLLLCGIELAAVVAWCIFGIALFCIAVVYGFEGIFGRPEKEFEQQPAAP